MKLFGREFTFKRKQLTPLYGSRGWASEWWPLVIHEPYGGAWQRNDPIPIDSLLSNTTVYRCVTLIAADIAKMRLQLMERQASGIDSEIESAPFSSVLREPNHYQDSNQFIQQWMISKLVWGNAYILKRRDARNVVNELYVLDPNRTKVLIAPNGELFYEVRRDDLAGITEDTSILAQNDIIHDRMNPLWHPLFGITPNYAGELPASQSLRIQKFSENFFKNMARPSGMLTAPGAMTKDTVERLKTAWETNVGGANAGRIIVASDGLKFEPMTQNAVDAELVPQQRLADEKVCTAFGVPPFKVGIAPPPAYDNIQAMNQEYYNNCLHPHINAIESGLKKGLELPKQYSVQFYLNDLLRMDSERLIRSLAVAVGAGITAPNEARLELGYGPVSGGQEPLAQQQYYSLAALANRPAAPPPKATPEPAANDNAAAQDAARSWQLIQAVKRDLANVKY